MLTKDGYNVKSLRKWTEYITVHHHSYYILEDDHGNFWGIRKEWLSNDGKISRSVNGITGNIAENMSDCLERCQMDSEFRYYTDLGWDTEQIVKHWIETHDKRGE